MEIRLFPSSNTSNIIEIGPPFKYMSILYLYLSTDQQFVNFFTFLSDFHVKSPSCKSNLELVSAYLVENLPMAKLPLRRWRI